MKTPPYSGFLPDRFSSPHPTVFARALTLRYNGKEKKTLTWIKNVSKIFHPTRAEVWKTAIPERVEPDRI